MDAQIEASFGKRHIRTENSESGIYELKIISLSEFKKWIEERKPFIDRNELRNWYYVYKLASEEKCKKCGKIGLTLLAGAPNSISLSFECNDCYQEWVKELIEKRKKKGWLK